MDEELTDEGLLDDDGGTLAAVVTWVGALAGAILARKALTAVWTQLTGDDPPENPAAAGTSWRDALLWGAAAGLVAGLSRTAGRRLASGAYANLAGVDEREVA